MNVRYAVRALHEQTGDWLYRSARWSDAFRGWDEAQLWENPKAAAREAERHRDGSKFHKARPSCTVVTVNIGEPE